MLYCIQFSTLVLALVGYALTNFGQYSQTVSQTNKDFWWYFFLTMTIYFDTYYLFTIGDVVGFIKNVQSMPEKKYLKKHFLSLSNILLTLADFGLLLVMIAFPFLVLFAHIGEEVIYITISTLTFVCPCGIAVNHTSSFCHVNSSRYLIRPLLQLGYLAEAGISCILIRSWGFKDI